MDNPGSLWLLMASTLSIGVLHALAPDHWVPFVGIGKARKWSKAKLAWITLVCGIGHVGSSILIGSIGIVLGFSLTNLEGLESQRGQVAGLLLVGFGLAYAVWGMKHLGRHTHGESDPNRSITLWALMAIFVLGPCEPLIPLMFVGAAHGWHAVFLVSLLFGGVTLLMMVGQALLGFNAADFLPLRKLEPYSHSMAGLIIALTGGMIMFLGI